MLKNIPRSYDFSAEDITEWLANDEVNELTENDIVEMLTEGEITEAKDEKYCMKNLTRYSQSCKMIGAALQYIKLTEINAIWNHLLA